MAMAGTRAPDRILTRLEPGERLVWWGRPASGLILRSRDWVAVPIGLSYLGFAGFWTYSVWNSRAPLLFTLAGVFFIVWGLYAAAGRLLHDWWRRSRRLYAVTNRRVMILRSGSLTSLDLNRLSELRLDERADGRGTITFGRDSPLDSHAFFFQIGWLVPPADAAAGFELIPDARKVYGLIREQQTAPAGGTRAG